MEELIASQLETCDALCERAKLMVEVSFSVFITLFDLFQKDDHGKAPNYYRESAVLMMKLKSFNRQIYSNLEIQRKEVEAKKESISSLFLYLENLKYKQSYLRKQIKVCKDLSTPTLNAVEKDLDSSIGITKFISVEDLKQHHTQGLQLLENEKLLRLDMQHNLTTLEQKLATQIEKVDKKRKFMDELPTRVALVKSAAADLQNQFAVALQDS